MSYILADTDAKKLHDELADWKFRNQNRAAGCVDADLYRRVAEALRDVRRKWQELYDALAKDLIRCGVNEVEKPAEAANRKESYEPKFADLHAANEQRYRALLDEIDGRQAPAPRAPKPRRRDRAARDKWAADLYEKECTPTDIYGKLLKIAPARKWEVPSSAKVLYDAIRRELRRRNQAG